MSSILDALEKLESRRTPGDAPEPPRRARRGIVPLLAGAAVAAFATGIALTAAWMRPADEPVAAAAPAVAPDAPSADVAPTPATNPPASPAPARAVEQPWGEVVSPPAPRTFTSDPLPSAPPKERRAPAALAAAPPPTTPPPAAARPAGAPTVQVSFLVYSSAADRRPQGRRRRPRHVARGRVDERPLGRGDPARRGGPRLARPGLHRPRPGLSLQRFVPTLDERPQTG